MDILALDLGTKTGFAWNRGDEFFCGTWVLGTDTEIRKWGKDRQRRTGDPRIERLCTHVTKLGHFDMIVIEDVMFASSVYQVQLWASLRAAVWLCCDATKFEAVPVQTLKKFACGNGAADKAAMSRFLKFRHWNLWTPELSDDTIDAIWIFLWAKETFARANFDGI